MRPASHSSVALGEKSPWCLESPRSQTTIARYASYQVASFKEALRDEKQRPDSTSAGMALLKLIYQIWLSQLKYIDLFFQGTSGYSAKGE